MLLKSVEAIVPRDYNSGDTSMGGTYSVDDLVVHELLKAWSPKKHMLVTANTHHYGSNVYYKTSILLSGCRVMSAK